MTIPGSYRETMLPSTSVLLDEDDDDYYNEEEDLMAQLRGTLSPSIPRRRSSLVSRSSSSSSSGSYMSARAVQTNPSSPPLQEEDQDEIIYALKTHTFTTIVPMQVETDIVPFDDLPEAAKREPTKILTWARQTPENLYLETIVPPSCSTCLEALEAKVKTERLAGAVLPSLPTSTIQPQQPKKLVPAQRINLGLAL
jgi:hypothetical protein